MSGLLINVDFCNLFADFKLKPGESSVSVPMTEEGLRQEIDYYAAEGVEAVIFNLNAMRAYFDSHVFEPVWSGLEEGPDHAYYFQGRKMGMVFGHSQLQMALRCRELYRNVPDPQKFRYEYCRRKGLKMYISMRMNDVHWTADPTLVTHADFWRTHPEFWRAHFKKDNSFWFAQCLDYAHREVYEHHLALVKEYFERFDMDGFELDWMRNPLCFRPGGEDEGRGILTRFMEEVRAIARAAEKKRGHEIRIVVRTLARPDDAFEAGHDVVGWAKRGLVDCVVPSPYFASSDAMLPVELWKQLLPENVTLAPCLECQLSSWYAVMPANPQLDAGIAADYYSRGADGIYLFNHMLRYSGYCGLDPEEQRRSFSILGGKRSAEAAARRHAAAAHDSILDGQIGTPAFQKDVAPGGSLPVRIHAGEGTAGRAAKVILGFQKEQDTSLFKVFLNGTECAVSGSAPGCVMPETVHFCIVCDVPDGVLHDGRNQIDLLNMGTESAVPLLWAEISLAAQ